MAVSSSPAGRLGTLVVAILLYVMNFLLTTEEMTIGMPSTLRNASGTTAEEETAPSSSFLPSSSVWRVGNASLVMERLALPNVPLATLVPDGNCAPTMHLELSMPVPSDTASKKWLIQTYSDDHVPKSVGGDEFYVTYSADGGNTDHFTAAALITDLHNGEYELEFVASPTNPVDNTTAYGTMRIYHEYTCGIGQLKPPTKMSWTSGGGLNIVYNLTEVPRPYIRPFNANQSTRVSLQKYDRIYAIGDSLMEQFARDTSYSNLVSRRIRGILNSSTVHTFLNPALAAMKHIGKNQTTAFIIGHFVFEILAGENGEHADDFDDHCHAIRQYIGKLREAASLHNNIDIFWKSGSAMQLHAVSGKGWFKIGRVKYLSSSRARHLYEIQRELMADLQIPVLDVYEFTYLSADWLKEGDGRHYQPELTQRLVSQFYES